MTTHAAAPPAGGAETTQVIGVTLAALVLTAALLWYGHGHRSGRSALLAWAARLSARLSGFPGWAAFPAALATAALGIAGLGLYWDEALHVAQGRDDGPLANPSHYLILAGLFGIFAAGWAAIVLPRERPGPAALRLADGWHVPVGGVLLLAAASFALIGFPLDDVWHRLFGQDVTLWGPTHLMLIGGGVLTIPGVVVLLAEGRMATRASAPPGRRPRGLIERLWSSGLRTFIALATGGGLLAGLSAFQGEFDFGVPQYSLLFHPLSLAVAAGLALVAARVLVGPGGALGAVLFFFAVRGLLALIVGVGFGEITAAIPLYAIEALIVELVALGTVRRGASPYRMALIAGPLVGMAGTLAEYAWVDAVMPLAWPVHMLPEAILVAVPAATGAAVVGAFFAGALRPDSSIGVGRHAWAAPALGVAAIAIPALALLPANDPPREASARITLERTSAGTAHATVRLSPATAAEDAEWVQGLAWQGGEHRLVTASMRRLDTGVYRTTEPLPLSGSWKSVVRIQRGRTRMSVPIYLPPDPAIPVDGVPARSGVTRPFESDIVMLQRERKLDTAPWLWPLASGVIALLVTAILALQGWGLIRIARAADGSADASRPRLAGPRRRGAHSPRPRPEGARAQ